MMGIPVIPWGPQIEESFRERVRTYEQRYEMSSEEMALALQYGWERETAEKLKWMSDYHFLRSRDERLSRNEETPTTGTRGIGTRPSTRSASLITSS